MNLKNKLGDFYFPESRLNGLKLLQSQPPESKTSYFDSRSTLAFVEDDHIPFMKRGKKYLYIFQLLCFGYILYEFQLECRLVRGG